LYVTERDASPAGKRHVLNAFLMQSPTFCWVGVVSTSSVVTAPCASTVPLSTIGALSSTLAGTASTHVCTCALFFFTTSPTWLDSTEVLVGAAVGGATGKPNARASSSEVASRAPVPVGSSTCSDSGRSTVRR
jgi:hypothetical protein